jgi:hypothetical protein
MSAKFHTLADLITGKKNPVLIGQDPRVGLGAVEKRKIPAGN